MTRAVEITFFQDLARQNGSLPLVMEGEPSDNAGWS